MKKVLTAIQDGSFAREWIAEMDAGSPSLVEARKELAETQIEQVGKRLRALGAARGPGGAWRRLTSRSPCSATAPSARRSTGCSTSRPTTSSARPATGCAS